MRIAVRAMLGMFVAVLCVSALQAQTDKTSIGGTVVNAVGGKAEAGAWVIAETKLGTQPYRKIVVTTGPRVSDPKRLFRSDALKADRLKAGGTKPGTTS